MAVNQLLNLFAQHYLPLRAVTITLRTSKDVDLPWFHHASLHAWLRGMLAPEAKKSTPPDQWLRLDLPECGKTKYKSGDYYTFSLICLRPGLEQLDALLDTLINKAQQSDTRQQAFGSHWTLVGVADLFTDQPLVELDQSCAVELQYFIDEAAHWIRPRARNLVWHWLSPARITLPAEQKNRAKGEARYCRDSRDTHLELLLGRCWVNLGRLLRDRKATPPARQNPPQSSTSRADIFWFDHKYSQHDGKQKIMGGQLGQLYAKADLDHPWLTLIVLCQYIGLGQRTDFGYGRFRLEGPDGEYTLKRATAQQSWLPRCLNPDSLTDAWRHVRANRPSAASHALTALDIEHELEEAEALDDNPQTLQLAEILESRIEKLSARAYAAPPAQAGFLPKPDGGMRPLAVPPFWDAVLQRAVASQLSEAVDTLMHERSFGYRRGRSRHQAAAAIRLARKDGYQWAFDADIEDFFGSVDHLRLQARLLALFDDDPIIDAIMAWVQAPVRWQGQDYPRNCGLPQGSSLSPVLANLMLDDFDNDMQAAGMRLVRFADDFVILCRSRERAEQAATIAADSLQEQGFSLNAAKTSIRDLDQGMDFLGYLFVGELALDLSGQNAVPAHAIKPLDKKHQSALASQWLAKLAGNRPKRLHADNLIADEAQSALSHRGALAVGDEQLDTGGVVFVAGASCSLYTQNRRLVVARDDKRLLERPWAHIEQLLLFGNHHITTPALRAACQSNTTVHLASAYGHYQACISNNSPTPGGHRLWLAQAVCAEDPNFALIIARALVASRLRHQREVLRLRGKTPPELSLTTLMRQVANATDSAQLNGVEGAAAAAYFEAFAALVPVAYAFEGRRRRPPPDPTNALLSLGYTLLYGYQDTLLRAYGLHPWTGLYHRGQGKHRALASDLMEPFRHTVEQLVLTLLRANSLPPELFERQASGICLILPAARRRFLADLGRRLETPISAIGEAEPHPLRVQMARQIQSLLEAVRARDPRLFKAFRAR